MTRDELNIRIIETHDALQFLDESSSEYKIKDCELEQLLKKRESRLITYGKDEPYDHDDDHIEPVYPTEDRLTRVVEQYGGFHTMTLPHNGNTAKWNAAAERQVLNNKEAEESTELE